MKLSKRVFASLLVCLLGFAFQAKAYEGAEAPFGLIEPPQKVPYHAKEYRLITKKKLEVGRVSIYNDLSTVYVQIETTDDYMLKSLSGEVARNLSGIPVDSKGKPKPQNFTHQYSFGPNISKAEVAAYNHSERIRAGLELYVAFEVKMISVLDPAIEEKAWIEGEQFPLKNGKLDSAMYVVFSTYGLLNAPATIYANFRSTEKAGLSTWTVDVEKVNGSTTSSEFDIKVGDHVGAFCLQKDQTMNPKRYLAPVFDVLDPEARPASLLDGDYAAVSVLINHRDEIEQILAEEQNDPGFKLTGTLVQNVIWKILEDSRPALVASRNVEIPDVIVVVRRMHQFGAENIVGFRVPQVLVGEVSSEDSDATF